MTLREYIDRLRGRTVAVIGIGVSNTPLLRLLLREGISVTACDRSERAKLGALAEELEAMKQAGLYGTIRTLEGPQGPWVTIGGRRVLNLCSNNYLGLCNHPRLVDKVKDYVDRYGVGPGAVRTIAGTLSPHLELERKLASAASESPASHCAWRWLS